MTGAPYFLSRLELFQLMKQEFIQSFGACGANRCDEGFYLFGQLSGFLYRLLQKMIWKSNLPAEEEWDSLHCFNFTDSSFLAYVDFMKKSHSRTAVLRGVTTSVDV